MAVKMGALNDPKSWAEEGRQGRIHIIDLANVSTCAFLATSDIGRRLEDGAFEVLGRYDHAEVRGCNLMAID
jgi:non-ribosomal peptide synthetase component F